MLVNINCLICSVNIVLEYIKYRAKAKGRHGIHSPFVYKMVDECFPTPISRSDQKRLSHRIRSLANDPRTIEVEDFGAGSKRLTKKRKVSHILKVSSSKGKYGRLLYRLSAYYRPKNILEFGTSLGIGSAHFALGNPQATITTVEACHSTREVALETFHQLHTPTVHSVQATFDQFLSTVQPTQTDLLFIDGHHDGEALLHYMNRLLPWTNEETLIVVDDIRWSDSMLSAWKTLCADSRFHVSIDLFRMGILSRRSGQEKEHFVVSY